ncbi:MAG TPA: cupin domain-containing protein [Pseudobdellovibrionaceae bacterium]|jgi:ribosomal protein L16 Arg81 hydroxylase
MTILEELISPLTFAEFQEKYLCRTPFAAPFKASRFRNLLSWSLLEEILSIGHPDCWLPRQGLLPTESALCQGILTMEQAYKGFSEGRTVVVRHAEKAQSQLREIAKDFAILFPGLVDVQLYFTPAGEEGFDWHYDIEDVFVLQSRGEKEFRLRPNTITPRPLPEILPKDLHFELEPSRCEIRCLLKAGDWLYIPSGYWHKARAKTPSFHISVGVRSSQNTSS